MRIAGVAGFFGGLAVVAAALACSSSSQGTASPGVDAGMCGGFSSTNTCLESCLEGSCCTQANACGVSADCNALFECIKPCTDSACVTACNNAHTGSVMTYQNFSNCIAANCTACNGDAGP